MSYSEVVKIFGQEGQSTSFILIQLSIQYPLFGVDDLVDSFKETFKNYHKKEDRANDFINLLGTKQFKVKHYSQTVFQNLYKLIDNDSFLNNVTHSWSFLEKMRSVKKEIYKQLKKNYADNIQQEKFEIASEFIDLIQSKMKEDAECHS